MNQHQRPLAFEQVAVRFLTVAGARFEIQQVILDLERGAEEEAKSDERIEISSAARAVRQPMRSG
jgi:hypothetical protein